MRPKKAHKNPPEFRAGEFTLSFRTNPRTGIDVSYKERHPEYTSADSCHDFWELLYVDKGQVQLFLEGLPFTLSQGEFVIILPCQMHGVGPSGTVAPFYVTAHFDTTLEPLRRLGNRILAIDEEGRRLLARMLEEKSSSQFESFGLARCYLAKFLIRTIRLQTSDAPDRRLAPYFQVNAGKQIIQRAMDYMVSNLEKPISLPDIARAVAVSRSHLEHAFKRHTGRSVMFHLQDLRIERAKKLLLESPLNISGIAAQCGYSSLHLFSRRFRKSVSVCPTEYARMVRAALPIQSNKKQIWRPDR